MTDTVKKARLPNFSAADTLILCEIMAEESCVVGLTKHAYLRHRFTSFSVGVGEFGNKCKCITVVITVVAVAWACAILSNFVGACIYKHCSRSMDLLECIFKLATLPCIFLLIAIIMYTEERKNRLIQLLLFLVVDGAFVGILIYLCSCREICEMLDLLWASFIYLILCALASALKYIIFEVCCANIQCDDSNSKSNPGSQPNVVTCSTNVQDMPETRRTLPRLPSVNSRPGNEKEYKHPVNYVKHAQRPLPPIAKKGRDKL